MIKIKTDFSITCFLKKIALVQLVFFLVIEKVSIAAPVDSISLEQLINSGINYHPSVHSKKNALDTYDLEKKAAVLKFLPSFSYIKSNAGGGASSVALAGSNFVSVNFPLFTGGASIYGLKRANKQIEVGELNLKESIQEISFKIITAYSDWTKAYYKRVAASDYISHLEQIEKSINNRYEVGVASLSEVNQVKSRILQADADRLVFLAQEKNSVSTLNNLCGTDVSSKRLSSNITLPAKIDDVEKVADVILQNDPYPKRAKAEIEIAEYDAKINEAQNYPQVFATAQRQIGSQDIYNIPSQNFYGITVQFNTSQGFSGFVSSAAAYSRAKNNSLNVDAAMIDYKIKLTSEMNEYISFQQKQTSISNTIILSDGVYNSYYRQYFAGKKSLVDVMNSLRESYNLKANLADVNSQLLNISWKFIIRASKEE